MDKIIERIQKLLALAKSANEHEAALAMQRANELLVKHNLDMVTVEGHGAIEEIGCMEAESKHSSPWVRNIWHATARLNFCEYVYSAYDHRTFHTIIGGKANTISACAMAEYLTDTVGRLAREARQREGGNNRFLGAFRKGCSARVSSRLWELHYEQKKGKAKIKDVNTTGLPMVIDQNNMRLKDYMDKNITSKKTKSRERSSDVRGYRAGQAAGDSVSLNSQIDSGANHIRIGNGG